MDIFPESIAVHTIKEEVVCCFDIQITKIAKITLNTKMSIDKLVRRITT